MDVLREEFVLRWMERDQGDAPDKAKRAHPDRIPVRESASVQSVPSSESAPEADEV